jgi:hypothetical protein
MLGQDKAKHGAFRMGGARNAKGVKWNDSHLSRGVLPFSHLFLVSVHCVHRDVDTETEIYERVLQTGGVRTKTAIHRTCGSRRCDGGGGGSGSRSRFEETVRAYRGLLTVKTLQGLKVSRPEFWIWWIGRRV